MTFFNYKHLLQQTRIGHTPESFFHLQSTQCFLIFQLLDKTQKLSTDNFLSSFIMDPTIFPSQLPQNNGIIIISTKAQFKESDKTFESVHIFLILSLSCFTSFLVVTIHHN